MAEGYSAAGIPDLQWWTDAITAGKQFRKTFAYEERWDTWRNWGRGKFPAGILPSNVYFKVIRSIVPRTYFRNPSISISATKPGMEYFLLARLLERVDNKLLDHMEIKGQLKRSVLNASMFGTGFVTRGYGAEFTPSPIDISTFGPDAGTRRMQNKVEYHSLVRTDQPWALNTHPRDVIVPAWTPDIHSARWTCVEYVRSRADIMDDPRFENKEELETRFPNRGQGRLITSGTNDRTRQGILLQQIRDKKTGLVFVIAPYTSQGVRNQTQKPLYIGEDKLQRNNRLPVYPLVFNEDDEQFWGIPDSIIIEPQQYEKNEIRTQIRNHRRILLKKFLYETGMIDPDELDKMVADDNVGIAIRVKGINSVKQLEAGQLPPGLVEAEALIDREVEEIIGLGVNQFGEYAAGSADRSATEANIVNQATQIRIDERRDVTADLLVRIVQDMNDDIIEYWGEDMLADVAGPGGVPIWIKFQPELLATAAWDVKVDPDSSIPLTKQYKEQKATQLYAALYGKNAQVDQNELTHFFLAELYGTEADSILLNPVMQTTQQNPMDIQQAIQHIQQLPPNAQAAVGQPGGNVIPIGGAR